MSARLLSLLGLALLVSAPARAQAQVSAQAEVAEAGEAPPVDLDLRLTLSSFLYRESGDSAPAVIDQGAALQNASPVRRAFGDLRMELSVDRLTLDGRVRQTGAQRFQSGATGASEYELRTLAFRLGNKQTSLTLGRQVIDAVGATKIDGAALTRALPAGLSITAFAGAFPALGSRSVDTDYVRVRNANGTDSARLFPLTGGVGLARHTAELHGDLGLGAVYVAQQIDDTTAADRTRVFATSSGYWRPVAAVDVYHFALVDLAGGGGTHLSNGSLGVDLHPLPDLKLSGALHHVSSELAQLATRDLLADPDPSAMGIVQNHQVAVRASQDLLRAGASVALARQRFELSLSGGLRRRPALDLELADGTGALTFPETRAAEASLAVLDRRSVAGLRAALTATMAVPLGSQASNRARSTTVRLSVGRTFAEDRGQLEVDAMAERLRDGQRELACMTSANPLGCYGHATTTAAQAGALASWRASREWLVLADAHVGYHDVESTSLAGTTAWPRVFSITTFLRLQWRVR